MLIFGRPLIALLIVSLAALHIPFPCSANGGDDIRADFWNVLRETRDDLSRLDAELSAQVEYLEEAAEHSRQGGSVSFEEYSDHSTKAIQLLSCLDTYQAHPGTEKLWEVLKRVYGNRALTETERQTMYRAANEVFDCSRSLLSVLVRLQKGLAQSNLQMH